MKSGNSRTNELLVCDTGPLLALGRVGFLPILPGLFSSCLVPDIVCAECLAKPGFPDATAVQQAVAANWLEVVGALPIRPALQELDAGEAATIELALARSGVALLDEKRGRALARRFGVRVLGSLGVILLAKQCHCIPAVMPYVNRMAASGYYLSPDLITRCRILAGE